VVKVVIGWREGMDPEKAKEAAKKHIKSSKGKVEVEVRRLRG